MFFAGEDRFGQDDRRSSTGCGWGGEQGAGPGDKDDGMARTGQARGGLERGGRLCLPLLPGRLAMCAAAVASAAQVKAQGRHAEGSQLPGQADEHAEGAALLFAEWFADHEDGVRVVIVRQAEADV